MLTDSPDGASAALFASAPIGTDFHRQVPPVVFRRRRPRRPE
jgi:hypothetical protein